MKTFKFERPKKFVKLLFRLVTLAWTIIVKKVIFISYSVNKITY